MKILESKSITPFGGLFFLLQELDNQRVDKLLSAELPGLAIQSVYGWREIVYSFWSVFFCGGNCIEDMALNIRKGLTSNPVLNLPSPDRVLNRMKELTEPKQIVATDRSDQLHEFSYNERMGKINLRLLRSLKLLPKQKVVLDFDHTMIFSEKADAKMTYKKKRGYNAGVGLIGKNVVFIENRNGNCGAHILQEQTMEKMFALLKSEHINVSTFRADSASFKFEALAVLNQHVDNLFIRPRMSQSLAEAIRSIDEWVWVKTDRGMAQRGETRFIPFRNKAKRVRQEHLLREYRLVVTKEPRADGQVNLFTGEAMVHMGIMTTNTEMGMHEVVEFYNQRGCAEKEFDVLKNDFGWTNMPFSKMEENTVFLFLSAMCRNIYAYMVDYFSKKIHGLRPHYRIKKFIFRFICIPAKWIYRARSWHLRLFGEVAFKT